ncbi:PilC/PilY family type IV pilus protein [Salinisphaera sp. S4-8]|uniref:pilus assembly protein n=1 Tax=Salinisphaera sp. S4-8 TaxID=633357 RepID=UPI00333F929F
MLICQSIPRLASTLALGILCLSTSVAAELKLADRPLLASNNVPPNILVAVDDSGSMDWETLFPTNSGLLYWDANNRTVLSGSNYIQNGGTAYGYLFPNGSGEKGRRIYTDYEGVPPTPQFGFARSSAYNQAYFDPTTAYSPWEGYSDATASAARYEPTVGNQALTLNLTTDQRQTDNNFTFYVTSGMNSSGVTYRKRECFFIFCNYEWVKGQSGSTFSSNGEVAIEYFPATFYMPANWTPPSDFGWKSGAAPLVGYSPSYPSSPDMRRYEIKVENFTTTAKYNKALQNFANWFTYYRKRHLATRAGITSAFGDINGARVGACTINQANADSPADLSMLMLNSENTDNYNTFNNQIFNIDYFSAKGTPNRPALKFLGEQLENNEDIIQSSCQRNFAILFTDGYNTSTVTGIGNTDQSSDARKTYGAPFGDNESNTIADVAMQYYERLGKITGAKERGIERNQLRVASGCGETPPDPWLDCQNDLHMVTLGVTLGQRGVLFDPDANYSESDPYETPPDWSSINVTGGSYGNEQIDDLWHATINSRGKLLNAKTPQGVADAFKTALEEILYQDGSLGGVSANSQSLETGAAAYQASYAGGTWEGFLRAYTLSANGEKDDLLWEASENIPAFDNRVILTSVDNGSGFEGIPFRGSKLANFLDSLLSPLGVSLSADIVSYIRGNQAFEKSNGGTFRNRYDNILGDIVQSTPTYVGSPDRVRYPVTWTDKHLGNDAANFPENARSAPPYSSPGNNSSFADKFASRTPMVYVGANDGMLHGFDADTGVERLAYIPGTLLDDVADLSEPGYEHRFYVDGSPVTGDAFFGGKWHTVLVSGLNNGGNAVFALDITDPGAFSEANAEDTVLWEYTADGELGQTYGKPAIVRLHNGEWAAIFGNGYNSPGKSASLHLVDIANGSPIRSPIDTNSAPTGNRYPNGLSEVTPIDVDGDFIVDYAYAGDLYGNVWRFDLTSKSTAKWSVEKLFTAEAPGGGVQPITMGPKVGVHPYGRNYGVMVYVGTGKYLEDTDALFNEDVRNSFYGVWDSNVFSVTPTSNWTPSDNKNLTRRNLQVQTITEVSAGDENEKKAYRVLSENEVTYKTTDDGTGVYGWYMDMPPRSGELLITTPTLYGDFVFFNTLIPPRETCDLSTSGAIMAVRADTGGRTDQALLDLNGDYKYNSSDTITINGEQVPVSGIRLSDISPVGPLTVVKRKDGTVEVIYGTSDGSGIGRVGVNVVPQTNRRVSWREIRR